MEKTNSPDIRTAEIPLRSGSKLHLFINRETNLLVIDLFDEGMTGGNELVRAHIDERKLLAHCDSGSAHLPTVKSSRDVVVLTESGALDAYHIKYGLKLPYRAEPECGCGDDKDHPLRSSCKKHGQLYSGFQKLVNDEPPKAYFLESISSEIYLDDYHEGELDDIGCGLPLTKIGKWFLSIEGMLEYLHKEYCIERLELQHNCIPPILEMHTSRQVADHSQKQNGGWFTPTQAEIEAWELMDCKLYVEHITVKYHTVQKEVEKQEHLTCIVCGKPIIKGASSGSYPEAPMHWGCDPINPKNKNKPCSICHGRGWLSVCNTETMKQEIQRCDECGKYGNDTAARKAADAELHDIEHEQEMMDRLEQQADDAAGDAEAARAEAEADAAAQNAEHEAEQREADEERDRNDEPPHNEGYY